MKKNKMMRLASGLLVAVLLTTSTISGTFAKYTTQDSGSDTARVAKWGVALQVSGDLYGTNYLTGTNTATDADSGISVQGTQIADTNVVAPGTKNEKGFVFSIKGTPEVSSQVTMDLDVQNIFLKDGNYGVMVMVGKLTEEAFNDLRKGSNPDDGLFTKDGEKFVKVETSDPWDGSKDYYTLEDYVELTGMYYPVIYTLDGDIEYKTGTCTSDSLAALALVLVKAVKSDTALATPDSSKISLYNDITSNVYAPNTDLAGTALNLDKVKITWEWNYDRGNTMYDGADTILGNLMETGVDNLAGVVVVYNGTDGYTTPTEYTHYCLDTKFDVDITVTQVD